MSSLSSPSIWMPLCPLGLLLHILTVAAQSPSVLSRSHGCESIGPNSTDCPNVQEGCDPKIWTGDGDGGFGCEGEAKQMGEEQQEESIGGSITSNGEPDPFGEESRHTGSEEPEQWLARLSQMLSGRPFAAPASLSRLLIRGCPLLRSLTAPWARLEVFLCELLAPALRDHGDCLGIKMGCPSADSNVSSTSDTTCALLALSNTHFACLEEQPPANCGESGLEMLASLRQESDHWASEFQCSSRSLSAGTITSSTTTPSPPDLQKDEGKEGQQQDGGNSEQTNENVLWALAKANQSSCGRQLAEERAAGLPRALIWTKICERADVLSQHADCLQELAQKEAQKCSFSLDWHQKANSSSNCAFLHNFGRTMDCAMGTLNELCPMEAQEAVVAVQEQLNDEAIALQCFQPFEAESSLSSSAEANSSTLAQFRLRPTHAPCGADQEEDALLCLAELADLPGRLQRLPSMVALVADRSVLDSVCAQFRRYEQCLERRVFHGEQRCALNSPLNGLARLGLSPVCAASALSQSASACLLNSSSPALYSCHHSVEQSLGSSVGAILQGAGPNAQAHLCKSFFSLREAFRCGRNAAEECDEAEGQMLAERMKATLAYLGALGLEEGCPPEPPTELLADDRQQNPVPQARALPTIPCHQQFHECVRPLTAFQPHPLAVIKQPRQIASACQAFTQFLLCRASLPDEPEGEGQQQCVPLWARGMSAMLQFVCGEGNSLFLEVRQCLRRTTGRPELKDCVLQFSRGAPAEACASARQLLDCALPPLIDKCGPNAGQFVRQFVGHFASALDGNCSLESGQPTSPLATASRPPVSATNCSTAQSQLVNRCALPLADLHSRLDSLFRGGLQNLLRNLNGVSALFQEGCSLSAQFRLCLSPLLSAPAGPCRVSSCLLASGADICDQPDVGTAIDSHLGCVFRQVSDPEFGRCIRSTLGPLRQLDLSSLRAALPRFVSCVEPIVSRQCGPVPLNVLRVLASQGECPLDFQQGQNSSSADRNSTYSVSPSPTSGCSPELRKTRENCRDRLLLSRYNFMPGTLLNLDAVKLEQFCADLDKLAHCERETRTRACDAEEPYGRPRALRALGTAVCSSRAEFGRHIGCLTAVSQSEKGVACALTPSGAGGEWPSADRFCKSVNASILCLAPLVFVRCGADALALTFSASNEYLAQFVPGSLCQLELPPLALQSQTGCQEDHLVGYLECESSLDPFRLRPVALLSNQSQWDEFCAAASSQFRPCVQALACRPEPATRSALFLHEAVCKKEVTRRDQRRLGQCLLRVTDTEPGQLCLQPFQSLDLMARDAGPRACQVVDRLLQCLADPLESECGQEALLHIYELYNGWTGAMDSNCVLTPPHYSGSESPQMVKVRQNSSAMENEIITKGEEAVFGQKIEEFNGMMSSTTVDRIAPTTTADPSGSTAYDDETTAEEKRTMEPITPRMSSSRDNKDNGWVMETNGTRQRSESRTVLVSVGARKEHPVMLLVAAYAGQMLMAWLLVRRL